MKTAYTMVLMGAVLSAGCLQLEETLAIREDGSGSLELNYSLDERAITQAQAAERLEAELAKTGEQASRTETSAATDPVRLFLNPTEEKFLAYIRSYRDQGIQIENLKVEARSAHRNVYCRISFPNLEALAAIGAFADYGFAVERRDDGAYRLSRRGATGGKTVEDLRNPQVARMLAPLLSGFKVKVQVNTPKKVLQTNADRHSAYFAEWIFDFSKDPVVLDTIRRKDFDLVIDGRGLKLPIITRPERAAATNCE